jgi:hypothetical protein
MASPRGAVYVIRCLATGEVYVGSTCNLAERWAAHRVRLRAGTHVNEKLQAAWDAYGEAAFEFGIVEEIGHPRELRRAEARHGTALGARAVGLGLNERLPGDFGDKDDEPAQRCIYGDVRALIRPSGERIYAQWMSVDARIVRRANTTPPA